MSELFKKKKLEILVEGALAPKVLALAEDRGATGYTVFPALYGKGRNGGSWQRDDLTPALGQVRVISSRPRLNQLCDVKTDFSKETLAQPTHALYSERGNSTALYPNGCSLILDPRGEQRNERRR